MVRQEAVAAVAAIVRLGGAGVNGPVVAAEASSHTQQPSHYAILLGDNNPLLAYRAGRTPILRG